MPPSTSDRSPRIVIGKIGLDGHDRGIKVVAAKMRDLGWEVIYMGTHQTIDAIISTAVQEDADIIGLSCHAGEQVHATRHLRRAMDSAGLGDVAICVGGTFPVHDIAEIRATGADAVVRIGEPLETVADDLRRIVRERRRGEVAAP